MYPRLFRVNGSFGSSRYALEKSCLAFLKSRFSIAFTPSRLYCCTGVGLVRLGSFKRRSAACPRPQPRAATMARREKYRIEQGYDMGTGSSRDQKLDFIWMA